MDQIEKAKHVGMLLAKSPLDQSIKDVILENIPNMKEMDLDLLMDSLQKEGAELDLFSEKLEKFFADRDIAWDALANAQKARVGELLDEFLKEQKQ